VPIIDIQARLRELGRIRMGVQVEGTKNGRTFRRPEKLATFRLTSGSQSLIVAAAAAYGGEVSEWTEGDRHEWQVTIETLALDIIIPPGYPVSQWFELWRAGGCIRRCDGQVNQITGVPCECPKVPADRMALAAKGEACSYTTRLNVMLPNIPDLGVWRLESHSYYAAVELIGAADILVRASEAGMLVPAKLRIDQRERKVPGQPTKRFPVPVIEFTDTRLADLPVIEGHRSPLLAAPARAAIPALPATTLPETSDFRARPQATLTEPDPEVAPVTTPAESGAARPVAGDGLTSEAFRDWLRANDVSAKYVDQVFRLVWPGREPGEISDLERARLRAAIDRARAGESI
jgi:hypothetical protein